MALTFADTHNMIAYLTKSDVSEGFDQIIDFLNTSSIQQEKVIITEDTVRQSLRLDDAESINCLPNEEIFIELARMGYEKPSKKLTFYKFFHGFSYNLPCNRRIGKGFSRVDTHLFDAMLVQQQVQDVAEVNAKDEDDNEVSAAPTPPSPTPATTPPPPQQEPIPSPPQAQSAQPLSPTQQQQPT
nr:hypothetical protein [Tanacetum cinerariifolium]